MHAAKDLLDISFSYESVGNFVRGMLFNLPPNGYMPPLNYPFSILCSGKALKDVIDYVKDTISLSYKVGTVPYLLKLL